MSRHGTVKRSICGNTCENMSYGLRFLHRLRRLRSSL